MAKKTYKIGDRVEVLNRSYIKGSRRPGFAGKFRYTKRGFGILIESGDERAFRFLQRELPKSYANQTLDQFREHISSHLGLANATGKVLENGLKEGNNVVLLDNGEVLWVGADQIK